jgi:hypothetical protein
MVWWGPQASTHLMVVLCQLGRGRAIRYYHQGRKVPSRQEKETSYGLGYAFKEGTRVHDAVLASPCIMPIQRN